MDQVASSLRVLPAICELQRCTSVVLGLENVVPVENEKSLPLYILSV
jgi:hypothetical protein